MRVVVFFCEIKENNKRETTELGKYILDKQMTDFTS